MDNVEFQRRVVVIRGLKNARDEIAKLKQELSAKIGRHTC